MPELGAGGQDVVLALAGDVDCIFLMLMESEWLADRVIVAFDPKDRSALGGEDVRVDQLVDPGAGLKRRIELDEGLWPQQPLGELRGYVVADPLIVDLNEAGRIGLVVADEFLSELEDVHSAVSPLLGLRPSAEEQTRRCGAVSKSTPRLMLSFFCIGRRILPAVDPVSALSSRF